MMHNYILNHQTVLTSWNESTRLSLATFTTTDEGENVLLHNFFFLCKTLDTIGL